MTKGNSASFVGKIYLLLFRDILYLSYYETIEIHENPNLFLKVNLFN